MSIKRLVKTLEEKNTELQLYLNRYKDYSKKITVCGNHLTNLELSKNIIIELGNKTQENVLNYIENTVTLAIQSVFGDEFKFKITADVKRDQQEIYFFIEHNDNQVEPKEDTMSGGIIDLCSFALRIIYWSLENPRSMPVILLDEPFKHVSEGFRNQVSSFVSELSKLVGIQIIMVSHSENLIQNADNVIYI